VRELPIDMDYVAGIMRRLLETPSPSGHNDLIVLRACEELDKLGIAHQLTRRGAIRATLNERETEADRAIVGHLDTLGAMVKRIRENGRLDVVMIGHWAARSAEGARVTVFSDHGKIFRGQILPLKASGHTFGEEVDKQDASWRNLEIRVDERISSRADAEALGINVGDHVAIDPAPEFTENGFVCSRHLDDKAGVAAMFGAAKAVMDSGIELPVDCHLLLTISEEVGVGASHVLHGDIAEMVSIDNGTVAPGQNSSEYGATIAMQDSSGPFDWHLSRKLIGLCDKHGIEHSRDVFRYYRSDGAAAIEAGNDIRNALVCFGCDASHGYERVHLDSIEAVAKLLALYVQTPLVSSRDRADLAPAEDFPRDQI
jgi:peptidase M42 family hydrolase